MSRKIICFEHGMQCDLPLFLHLEHRVGSKSAAPFGYAPWDKWRNPLGLDFSFCKVGILVALQNSALRSEN